MHFQPSSLHLADSSSSWLLFASAAPNTSSWTRFLSKRRDKQVPPSNNTICKKQLGKTRNRFYRCLSLPQIGSEIRKRPPLLRNRRPVILIPNLGFSPSLFSTTVSCRPASPCCVPSRRGVSLFQTVVEDRLTLFSDIGVVQPRRKMIFHRAGRGPTNYYDYF